MYGKLFLLLCGLAVSIAGTAQTDVQQDSLYQRVRQLPPSLEKVQLLYQLGESYVPGNINVAGKFMRDGLNLSIQLGYYKGIADFTGYYRYWYDIKGDYVAALYLLHQGDKLYQYLRDTSGSMLCNAGLGEEYLMVNNPEAAAVYYQKALQLAQLLGDSIHTVIWGGRLQAIQSELHDSLAGNATRSRLQLMALQDAAQKEEKLQAAQQIARLHAHLQLQQRWGLGIIVLILLVLITYVYRRWRKEQEWQQRRIVEVVETERTIHMQEAMLQGEERERRRLSKELQEKVGGLLSAVKKHFSKLQQEEALLSTTSFLDAMQLLDHATEEVMRTADQLKPEILSRMGLSEALGFYCRNVSYSRKLQITYCHQGEMKRYKAGFELSVYRIAQELINNLARHSRASAALVQLSEHPERLTITIEDNGIGFQHQPELQHGTALKHLYHRIKALNGDLEIDINAGRGTMASIAFNVGGIDSST
ncbi:hypothetical protein CLV59_110115 [Chitinophaga dinghuensis]|uniref:Histidine kinase/HSP90-like ATPase domain-containing protein n=1 Tax=Chitinophaga dinghuensis TaxID=1539050 RepID=A0A327VNL4_9BACT|nr:ATP-binding protein [Chitinophaga dinghuensis]RAJ75069.1 hypothetical protein CLV59_110115 [Chitinophaga dinghuensis]